MKDIIPFPHMCEYGFKEGKDFCSNLRDSTGGRPSIDHTVSKELCMLQRSEMGRKFRQYFISASEDFLEALR